MKRVISWSVVAVVSLALFSSCERDVYSLTVTPEAVNIVRKADHPVLSAAVVDYQGEEIPITDVKWHSSDPRVVEVSDTGRLVARTNGEATITAKTKNDEVEVKVTVRLIDE